MNSSGVYAMGRVLMVLVVKGARLWAMASLPWREAGFCGSYTIPMVRAVVIFISKLRSKVKILRIKGICTSTGTGICSACPMSFMQNTSTRLIYHQTFFLLFRGRCDRCIMDGLDM